MIDPEELLKMPWLTEGEKSMIELLIEKTEEVVEEVEKQMLARSPVSILMEIFPALNQFFPVPKVCLDAECWSWKRDDRVITQDLLTLILHLNDAHELPREQVADWLESLDADLTFKGDR